jgi:ribosomal protein S18 acetylase RimI-like enzyme
MIDEINTRKLTVGDLEEIMRVEKGAWGAEELDASEETVVNRFKENPGGFIGHFEKDGDASVLMGFVYFRRVLEYRHFRKWVQASRAPLAPKGNFAYIVNVSVYPKRRGHGRRMMNNVARMLYSAGIEEAALGSRDTTELFYDKCGYQVYERIADWWPDDEKSAGKGILMKTELKKVYR